MSNRRDAIKEKITERINMRKEKLKKTKLDKVLSIFIFVAGLIWFFVDKSIPLITDLEIRFVLQATGVLSAFYAILSFAWDYKFEKVREKLTEEIADIVKEVTLYKDNTIENHKELKAYIQSNLLDRGLVESRILSHHEMNIREYLECSIESSSYAQIFIITNSSEVEEEQFSQAIKKNILDNHQYIYITPYNDLDFTKGLEAKIFEHEKGNHLLAAAFHKNIRHIRDEVFFNSLPEFSDMVIYVRKELFARTQKAPIMHGFYCFQNGAYVSRNIKDGEQMEYYYYTEMPYRMAEKIVKKYQEVIEWDSASSSWLAPVLEERDSLLGGRGMFAKEAIKKGTILIRKGGLFIKKADLDSSLRNDNSYIQIDDEYVLSSKKSHEDMRYKIRLLLNHSCKRANCGMSNEIEIVAITDIKQDDELLINYGFWDIDYTLFSCKNNCQDGCCRMESSPHFNLDDLRDQKNYIAPYLREKLNTANHANSQKSTSGNNTKRRQTKKRS